MTVASTRTGPVGVGIIGAGVISQTYLDNLGAFADTEVVAIGDLFPEAAQAKAAEHGVATSGDVDAVLHHPDVEIVVNLTIPQAHAMVAAQAIAAGKHVYNEKPLSLDRESADELLTQAAAAGLRVGCAPDTFLGAGWQAVRHAVERGDVGEPLTALTLMQQPGPEAWHPNPAFLFQEGAGPLFDIGPYYITALVQLFGAVERVAASGGKSRETRVIGSGPKAGTEFDVTVPTHVSASLQFGGGKSATSIYSFDSPARRILLELTGTEATLGLPDPNMFDGDLLIKTRDDQEWRTLASTVASSSRGTGVLDLARAIREDRPHRASGELARHVLDTMVSTAEAVDTREYVEVTSEVEPAALLPPDWDPVAATL
ncbi:MAG: Gfo/Idh/MocA family protein [Propionibacteriaceae bacterium]